MAQGDYFEGLCTDVYDYYRGGSDVVPKRYVYTMLLSMGCVWKEEELPDLEEFVSFTDFRRLAIMKWNVGNINDGSQYPFYTYTSDKKHPFNSANLSEHNAMELEKAFKRISTFYGYNGTLPIDLLFRLLTEVGKPLEREDVNKLLSGLHTYNDNVTLKSLVSLLGRIELQGVL